MRVADRTIATEAVLIAEGDRQTEVIPGLPVADTGWMSRMEIDRLLPPVVTSAAAPPPERPSKRSKSRRSVEPTATRKSFLRAWLAEIAADVKAEALKPVSYVYLALLAGLGTAVCMGIISVRTPDLTVPTTRPPAVSRPNLPASPQIRPVVPLEQPVAARTPTASPTLTQRTVKVPAISSGPPKRPVTHVPPVIVEPTSTPDPSTTPNPPVTPPADPSNPPAEPEKVTP